MSKQWSRYDAELADTIQAEHQRRPRGQRVIQCPADGMAVVLDGLKPISRCACDDQAEDALAAMENGA